VHEAMSVPRSHQSLPVSGRVDLRFLGVVRKSDKKMIFKCSAERRGQDQTIVPPEEAAVNALVQKRSFDEKVLPGKRILLQNATHGFQLACMADQFNHGFVCLACAAAENDADGLFFVVQTLLLQLHGSILHAAQIVQEGGLQEHLDVTAKLLRPGSGVDFPDLNYRSLGVRQMDLLPRANPGTLPRVVNLALHSVVGLFTTLEPEEIVRCVAARREPYSSDGVRLRLQWAMDRATLFLSEKTATFQVRSFLVFVYVC